MRIVVQRVSRAAVRVRGETVAEIGTGLLLLVGVGGDDAFGQYDRLAEKVVHLRVFVDVHMPVLLDLRVPFTLGWTVSAVPAGVLYFALLVGLVWLGWTHRRGPLSLLVAVALVYPFIYAFSEAQRLSRETAERIEFTGKVFRRDIGWRKAGRLTPV